MWIYPSPCISLQPKRCRRFHCNRGWLFLGKTMNDDWRNSTEIVPWNSAFRFIFKRSAREPLASLQPDPLVANIVASCNIIKNENESEQERPSETKGNVNNMYVWKVGRGNSEWTNGFVRMGDSAEREISQSEREQLMERSYPWLEAHMALLPECELLQQSNVQHRKRFKENRPAELV